MFPLLTIYIFITALSTLLEQFKKFFKQILQFIVYVLAPHVFSSPVKYFNEYFGSLICDQTLLVIGYTKSNLLVHIVSILMVSFNFICTIKMLYHAFLSKLSSKWVHFFRLPERFSALKGVDNIWGPTTGKFGPFFRTNFYRNGWGEVSFSSIPTRCMYSERHSRATLSETILLQIWRQGSNLYCLKRGWDRRRLGGNHVM